LKKISDYVANGGSLDLLDEADQFLLVLKTIPDLETRLRCFLFKVSFREKFNDVCPKLKAIRQAIAELRDSQRLLKFAEIVLAIGNFMNGAAAGCLGFKIETFNKLIDTKTIDNESTLLHYLVQLVEKKCPDCINLYKDFPSIEAASKTSWAGVQTDVLDLKSQFAKLLEAVMTVKPASKNDPFLEVMPPALEQFKEKMAFLSSEVEVVAKEYKSLEESFRGESDGSVPPEEMFTQFHKFIENIVRVKSDLEMARVKRDRSEQKENKTKAALLTEIQKGIKLRKTPAPDALKDKKSSSGSKILPLRKPAGSRIGQVEKSQQNAKMGNIAAAIAKRNQDKMKKTIQTPRTHAVPGSKLDALIMELSDT